MWIHSNCWMRHIGVLCKNISKKNWEIIKGRIKMLRYTECFMGTFTSNLLSVRKVALFVYSIWVICIFSSSSKNFSIYVWSLWNISILYHNKAVIIIKLFFQRFSYYQGLEMHILKKHHYFRCSNLHFSSEWCFFLLKKKKKTIHDFPACCRKL